MCISSFLENALVSRVNRRLLIRSVRLLRSMYDVEMCSLSGLPMTSCFSQPRHRRRVATLILARVGTVDLHELRVVDVPTKDGG